MADNTTIAIVADTSKARADIKLLSEQVKDFGRQVAGAVKQGDTARAESLSKTYGTMADRLSTLRRGLAEVGGTGTRAFNDIARAAGHADSGLQQFIHSGRGLGRVVSEFATLGRGLESITGILGTLTGGFLGGFVGVAVARAIDGVIGQLDEMEKKLIGIRDLSRETATPPLQIQAAQEIAKEIGASVDDVTTALKKMAQTGEQARTKMQPGLGPQILGGAGRAAAGMPGDANVQVLRGTQAAGDAAETAGKQVEKFTSGIQNGVRIMRAGAPVLSNFAEPLEIIGVNLANFGTVAEQNKARLQGFMDVVKGGQYDLQQLNAISKGLFNLPAQTVTEIAPAWIANLDKQIEELKKAPRGATPERIDLTTELNKAKAELDKVLGVEDIQARILDWWKGVQIATNRGLVEFIGKTLPAFFTDISNEINRIWQDSWNNLLTNTQKAYDDFTTVWKPLVEFFSPLIESIANLWNNFFSWLDKKAEAFRQLVGFQPSTSPVAGAPIPANATGGYIRGAGSGTSDSILARLSNGEFVVNAASVRRIGVGFLQGLNSFAGGGLVMPSRSLPSFAAGGLVSAAAGGGRPVHLHLGGHSFALSGAGSVVDSLVAEAHSQQMRSAGTKPSWYGARPGGR